MDDSKIFNDLNVSRETFSSLREFIGLLGEWNKKINLVSRNSLNDVWSRHIDDSAQLWYYLPKNPKRCVDLGSGAGFPGLILALLAKEKNPGLTVILVDANRRKCAFLEDASRVLRVNVEVIPERIENLTPLKADILSARALTSTKELLLYLEKHGKQRCRALFLKGKNIKTELREISNLNDYCIEIFPSYLAGGGSILQVEKRKSRD